VSELQDQGKCCQHVPCNATTPNELQNLKAEGKGKGILTCHTKDAKFTLQSRPHSHASNITPKAGDMGGMALGLTGAPSIRLANSVRGCHTLV
jgi:hypothetical protein